MDGPLETPVWEITRLRGCLNDLNRIMGLPAVWAAGGPSRIVDTFLNELVGTLRLSFAFVRLNDPEGGPSVEMMRASEPSDVPTCPREIGNALVASMGHAPLKWPPRARVSIRNVEFWI